MTPNQPAPVDQIAQECAKEVFIHAYDWDIGEKDVANIIAAAIAKAVEQERSEANERMQIVMDAEAILTRKVEMERNRISRERDQLRAALDVAEGAGKALIARLENGNAGWAAS